MRSSSVRKKPSARKVPQVPKVSHVRQLPRVPEFRALIALAAVLLTVAASSAQRPTLSDAVKSYVRVNAPVVALTNVRVIDSNPPGVFDDAAVAAVRGWRFHPAISNGKPVVKELVSRVNFKLGESEGYAR